MSYSPEITSTANVKFRRWQSLLDSKGIKKEQRALLSGERLVRELSEQQPDQIEEILLPPKSNVDFDRYATHRLSGELFNALDVIGTHSPLAVVRLSEIKPWQPRPPRGLELILALSDPSNLGAMLRSAEAFGAATVILTQEAASPFLPKALKAASLSTFRVPLMSTGPLRELHVQGLKALDMEGQLLQKYEWPRDLYLLLGEEGRGLPESLEFERLKIPMLGKVESLNATVAASLALFSYRQKHSD